MAHLSTELYIQNPQDVYNSPKLLILLQKT